MKRIILIVIVAMSVKVLYILFGLAYNKLNNSQIPTHTNKAGYALSFLHRNDSYWYEMIAVNGHSKITPDQLGECGPNGMIQSYYEFLPLYPFSVRLAMKATNLDFQTIALLYSMVLSLAAFILFFYFARMYTGDDDAAVWGTLLLIVFPFHYYFSMFYSESLYLVLLIGSFLAIRYRKWAVLSILLALLALVRPNGIFMSIPLLLYLFETRYSLDIRKVFQRKWREYLPLLAFISAPAALLAYCFYLHAMTGDFFAYITARRGWCLCSTMPWVPVIRISSWEEYFRFGYLLFFLVLSLILARRIPLSMQALIWINIFLPLTSNMLTLPRFISTIFIFPVIFGVGMTKIGLPWKIGIATLLFLLQLCTFTFWISGHPFSY
jgi:Gpi18-like mannosyltransferase